MDRARTSGTFTPTRTARSARPVIRQGWFIDEFYPEHGVCWWCSRLTTTVWAWGTRRMITWCHSTCPDPENRPSLPFFALPRPLPVQLEEDL